MHQSISETVFVETNMQKTIKIMAREKKKRIIQSEQQNVNRSC